MFLVLSKVLSFLVSPTLWIFSLLIWSAFTKNGKRKKRLLITSIVLFFIFSNSVFQNEVRRLYEPDISTPEKLKGKYDIGIVLSGMVYFNRENNQAHFIETSDRIKQAIDLYGLGKIKRIMISGGSGNLSHQDMKEADYMRDFLINLGIPDDHILLERESRNTYENARNTATQLNKIEHGPLLLITSSTHMPRAEACFEKVGLVFDTYVANPVYPRDSYSLKGWLVPNAAALWKWQSILHEWVGMVAYQIKGYI